MILLLTLTALSDVSGEVRMPGIFSDNMVLQQQTQVKLWGWADGGTVTIHTAWNERSYTVTPDDEGRWSLRVQTPAAGGPYTITVSDGKKLALNNVMIGEVWICSGQSNMAMPLKGYMSQPVRGGTEAIVTAGKYRERIRVLTLPRHAAEWPMEDFTGASWHVSIPEYAPEFSAVAFFFARYLTEALGVPVGIVDSSWGGSDIEAWMDDPSNREAYPNITIPACENTPKAKQPVVLYNGMIRPIAGYTARGFLWYQGEGNAKKDGRYSRYAGQLEALVGNWRRIWENDRMPFFIVQIAPHANGNASGTWFPRLVEQQLKASDRLADCWIAPATDLGEPNCIHPADKQTVGLRLAALAIGNIYCDLTDIPLTGPRCKSYLFGRGSAEITFDNASLGLTPVSEQIEGFEMAGEDRIFHPAKAVVNSKRRSTVTVTCDRVAEPVAVRYAFRNHIHANLSNSSGFPAFPFRTDDWEDDQQTANMTATKQQLPKQ